MVWSEVPVCECVELFEEDPRVPNIQIAVKLERGTDVVRVGNLARVARHSWPIRSRTSLNVGQRELVRIMCGTLRSTLVVFVSLAILFILIRLGHEAGRVGEVKVIWEVIKALVV